ncbi:MAG: hypothetical protein ABW168_23950 [Sedimenticola sp.]
MNGQNIFVADASKSGVIPVNNKSLANAISQWASAASKGASGIIKQVAYDGIAMLSFQAIRGFNSEMVRQKFIAWLKVTGRSDRERSKFRRDGACYAGVCNTYVIDGEYKKVITYGLLCVRNDKLYYKPFYPGTKIATHTVDLNQAMKRTGNKWMPG